MLENLGPWILPLIIIGVVVSWMKRVKNDERLVVFRLGRLHRVVGSTAGSRIAFVFPLIDRGLTVKLEQTVPDWKSLPDRVIEERVKETVLSNER